MKYMLPPDIGILLLNDYYRKDKICLCSSNKQKKSFFDCCFRKNLTFKEFYYNYLLHYKKPQEYFTLCAENFVCDGICSNPPINSHSISKSKYLKEISISNLVVGFKPKQVDKDSHIYKLLPISINNASTFKGCCLEHDNFYSKIDANFNPEDYRDYLLLAKRQYLYEYSSHFQKERRLETFLFSCKLRDNLLNYLISNRNIFDSIYSDYKTYLTIYDAVISFKEVTRNFSCYALEFNKIIPFSFSTIYSPLRTLSGIKLGNPSTTDFCKSIFYSLFTVNNKSYLVFTVLKIDQSSQKFIKEIIDDKKNISKNLLKLSIITSNTYYNESFIKENDLQSRLECLYGLDLELYMKDDYAGRSLLLEEYLYNYDDSLSYNIIHPKK